MTKYKINWNKPEPSEEQINKHKDFQNILNNHQKILKYKDGTKPLYKNKGFLGFIVLLSIVLMVFVITENESKQTTSDKDFSAITTIAANKEESVVAANSETLYTKQPSAISVVTKTIYKAPEVPFKTFSVDPAKGAIIYMGSSRILIPPYAFIGANGKIIEDIIEIKYREFVDPVDIFSSGIPMHYDSIRNSQLISASMFEIRSFAKEKNVSISKPITVEMATTDHKNYNHYYLNEKTKSWDYISKEKKSVRFVFEANEKDFPEMIPFKGLIWESEVSDQQSMDDFKLIFSKTWSMFFLDEKQKPSSNITLKKNSSEPKFLAVPIALSSDQDLNKKIIQAKYTEYYELMKKKQKDEALLTQSRLKQQEWLESEEGKAYLKWSKSDDGKRSILSSRIISLFTINKFGIWNCDTPDKLSEGAQVVPSYKDKNGNDLSLLHVVLVDYNKNSIYSYYPGHSLNFNPKSDNVLWAVLPEGKLAFFSKEQFKTISNKGKVNFKMEIIDINAKSEMDIKNILGMKNHIVSKQLERDKNKSGVYERTIVMKKETVKAFFESEGTIINSNGQVK